MVDVSATQAAPSTAPAGSLADRVREFDQRMRELLPHARASADWEPLAAFVNAQAFVRTGCFCERQDWAGYLAMLSQWAGTTAAFETRLIHLTEAGRTIFYEIEETHRRRGNEGGSDIVNSMTTFTFDEADQIVSLRVYLQSDQVKNK